MRERLGDLQAITDMVFEVELSRLKAVSEELAARRAEIDNLTAAHAKRTKHLAEGGASEDLAFLHGRDARFSIWMAREKGRLNMDLAKLAARRQEQLLRAQKALGKRDVLRRLSEHEAAVRTQSRRRNERP